MKPVELYMTVEELDVLCGLYMACELSVLEEKELEYVLSHTAMSSPAIDEVRALMCAGSLRGLPQPRSRRRWLIVRAISGIAACAAVTMSVALWRWAPSMDDMSTGGADVLEKELGTSGRLLVRYSGTENKLRIMLEGKDEKIIETYANDIAEMAVNEIKGK